MKSRIQVNANELKKKLGSSDYGFLKSKYFSAKGTIDIYILFFELGLKSLSKDGVLVYITPNRFLSASYGKALRNFIYDGYYISTISDFSSVNVFESASTYPIVTLLTNTEPKSDEIIIRKFDSKFRVLKEWTNNYSDLNLLQGKIWGFLLNSKIRIVKVILEQAVPLTRSGTINATSTALSKVAIRRERKNSNYHYAR